MNSSIEAIEASIEDPPDGPESLGSGEDRSWSLTLC